MSRIGILHPGEMGISVAASALNNGHHVYWVSRGRSDTTRLRAEKQNLIEIQSMSEFCQTCEVIICICPPHAAEDVASLVIRGGFGGIYLDANAISPQRAVKLDQMMGINSIRFIDGSIIGGPALNPGETWLYLSGKHAEVIADYFKNGPLETKVIGNETGKASALKMCYASYSKGITALLISSLATAEALGVREDLYRQWSADDQDFPEKANRRVIRATAKAWRFEGEMKEIASTFQGAGLPSGFHEAAAEIYRRMANLKDANGQTVDEILDLMIDRAA